MNYHLDSKQLIQRKILIVSPPPHSTRYSFIKTMNHRSLRKLNSWRYLKSQHFIRKKTSPELWCINSLPTSGVCWYPLQTVWTQIRPDKMLGLILTQSVWHSDGIPDRFFFEKVDIYFFWKQKNQLTTKKRAKLPSMQRVKTAQIWCTPCNSFSN